MGGKTAPIHFAAGPDGNPMLNRLRAESAKHTHRSQLKKKSKSKMQEVSWDLGAGDKMLST